MKSYSRPLALFTIVIISSLLYNVVSVQNANEPKNTSDTYKIKALKLSPDLNLAGERVPLEKHDIRERMDRELLVNTYWQSNGLLLLKRANKYFPILEPLLKNTVYPMILNI